MIVVVELPAIAATHLDCEEVEIDLAEVFAAKIVLEFEF